MFVLPLLLQDYQGIPLYLGISGNGITVYCGELPALVQLNNFPWCVCVCVCVCVVCVCVCVCVLCVCVCVCVCACVCMCASAPTDGYLHNVRTYVRTCVHLMRMCLYCTYIRMFTNVFLLCVCTLLYVPVPVLLWHHWSLIISFPLSQGKGICHQVQEQKPRTGHDLRSPARVRRVHYLSSSQPNSLQGAVEG